jgi:hypothetical protein
MILSDEDARLLARAAAWTGPECDPAELARTEGLDFATALLHDRILRVPANGEFFHSAREAQRPTKICTDLIGVVPGAFHREHRDTGANGARVLSIAEKLACEAEVIPTASFGTLDENARVILDWITSHRDRRIALISLSKGGTDVKRALSQSGAADAFANVSAWVSFSGMVQGTYLIEWLRRRPLRWWSVRLWLWWRGHNAQALDELRHDANQSWPALPDHLSVAHVFGFPLERHLAHAWAPRGYARLSSLGPNDGGGILLGDCTKLPGIVCPIWGADHYLIPPWEVHQLLTGIVATALRK